MDLMALNVPMQSVITATVAPDNPLFCRGGCEFLAVLVMGSTSRFSPLFGAASHWFEHPSSLPSDLEEVDSFVTDSVIPSL